MKKQGEPAPSSPLFDCCSDMEPILEPEITVRVHALRPDVHHPRFFWEILDSPSLAIIAIPGRWSGSMSYLKWSREGFAERFAEWS
jgi:hypothetical protein